MADLTQSKPIERPVAPFRIPWTWLGALPFFAFIGAFLFWPAVSIAVQSFFSTQGQFTFQNLIDLGQPFVAQSYIYTIEVSIASAFGGGLLGFLLAYAISVGGLPSSIRSALLTFSGVASNFAGIPLAFAFIATLGQLGVVTQALRSIGISLYPTFSLYTFWGLVLTYTYFQIPLMILIMAPAFDGLRREWREASENLGASNWQYWRFVALPILTPSILGTFVLLFGNAFGAQATAFALTGGASGGQVITILIASQLSGDSLANPGIGNAIAFGMIVIMSVTIAIYTWLQRQSERWLRR